MRNVSVFPRVVCDIILIHLLVSLLAHKCPYPGCGKDFSRHDNLGQHMRVHKNYKPPMDDSASVV